MQFWRVWCLLGIAVSSLDKTRKGSQGSFKGSNNRVLLVLSNKRSLRHEDDNDQARTREDWFGWELFYSHDPESMNDRIKKRKGKGSQKRSWTECVDLLQSLAEEQVRNGERALINVGPLQLSAGFAHMKITLEKWLSLSSQQKERKVSLFRSASTGNGLCRSKSSHSSSTCTSWQHVLPSEMQDEEQTKEDDDSESPVVDKTNSSTSGNLIMAATMGMP